MRPFKIITPVAEEPLSIDECRTHLEAQPYNDSSLDGADDAMILAFLSAAREHCENFLGLSLAPRTLEIALDEFPAAPQCLGIELPFGPVRAIVSFMQDDTSDGAVSDYVLDDYRLPARLLPSGDTWPTVTAETNRIKVRYIAGYGVDSTAEFPLPYAARAAMLLMLGHLYAHREDTTEKALASVPNGVEALLRPLRVRLGMA